MPRNKDFKRLVRARMAATGERYTQALTNVQSGPELEPLPAPWHLTGTRAVDYEVGLLPAALTYDGTRIVRLRLRATVREPAGFGALVQSIAAGRYLGRRVRFSTMARAQEVTDWAGLWLRVDAAGGPLLLDNMQDRPLRETTAWARADIVVDVPEQATELHFGALLTGAGAVDLAQPRFVQVGDDIPVTAEPFRAGALPDEPQALDFGGAPPERTEHG